MMNVQKQRKEPYRSRKSYQHIKYVRTQKIRNVAVKNTLLQAPRRTQYCVEQPFNMRFYSDFYMGSIWFWAAFFLESIWTGEHLDQGAFGPGSIWTGEHLILGSICSESIWTREHLDRGAFGSGSIWTREHLVLGSIWMGSI